MKRIVKIITVVATTLFAFGFLSCSNFQGTETNISGNNACITIGLDGSEIVRTVLPDVQGTVFSNFVLKGTKQGEAQKTLGTWGDLASMKKATVPVAIGTWSFTLTAESGGSSFSGTLQKEIVTGQNSLSFNLALSDFGSGKGSFTLNFSFATAENSQNVSSVTGSLENMSGTVVSGYSSKNLAISNNAVTFTGTDISAGTYRAKVRFCACVNGVDTEIASWSELVQIASGFTSSASRTIESFDGLCSISYVLNGGSFVAGTVVPETFCRKSGRITLPQNVARDYYTFNSWHTDVSCADNSKISSIENKVCNIVVYAKWTPIVYTINYDIDCDSAIKSYTVEDDVTLPELYGDGMTFYGWYDNKDYAGAALTGWRAGEKHSDVALFADCTIDFSANESDIVAKITEMKKSGTIKASGTFSTELMTEINNALKKVDKASPKILISFDFENVKMPKEWTLKNHPSLFSVVVSFSAYSFEAVSEQFGSCKSLKTVTIKSGVIGPRCFSGCSALKTISLPASLENIYEFTFSDCSSLENIEIPGSVKSIGEGAFKGCSSLKSVTLPNGLKLLCRSLFEGCSSLESVNIPEAVTKIENRVFSDCKSLENMTIPNGVTSIDGWAFVRCTSLKRITISSSVNFIAYQTFKYCDESFVDAIFLDTSSIWYWENRGEDFVPKESNKIGAMSATDTAANVRLLKMYVDKDWYKLQE